jgi:hypothetical protein
VRRGWGSVESINPHSLSPTTLPTTYNSHLIFLKAGERRTVTLLIKPNTHAVVNVTAADERAHAQRTLDIAVGDDSTDTNGHSLGDPWPPITPKKEDPFIFLASALQLVEAGTLRLFVGGSQPGPGSNGVEGSVHIGSTTPLLSC